MTSIPTIKAPAPRAPAKDLGARLSAVVQAAYLLEMTSRASRRCANAGSTI